MKLKCLWPVAHPRLVRRIFLWNRERKWRNASLLPDGSWIGNLESRKSLSSSQSPTGITQETELANRKTAGSRRSQKSSIGITPEPELANRKTAGSRRTRNSPIRFTLDAAFEIVESNSIRKRLEFIILNSPANVRVMATPLARASVDRGVEVEISWEHGEQRG